MMDRSSPRISSESSEDGTKQEAWESASETFRRVLESRLEHDEKPLAWFAPDLDHSFCYGRPTLLVLADRRLLCLSTEREDPSEVGRRSGEVICRNWRLKSPVGFGLR